MISTIFTRLKRFLASLSKEVEEGHTLIAKIVESFSNEDKERIVYGITMYFKNSEIQPSGQKKYFDGFFPKTTNNFSKLIKTLIRNIYPSSIKTTFNIEYFSHSNNRRYFKISNIKKHLFSFMTEYTPKLDDELIEYMSNLIDDVIDEKYVFKLSRDKRYKVRTNDKLYENAYYLLMDGIERRDALGKNGTGGLPTPNKKFVVEKESTGNDFTHEECKMWAMMPIFNPRTLEPILIDSPLYNLLLSKSYQYDTNLIPRMITSRGYDVLHSVLFTKDYSYASQSSSSS